ncbi:CamS family sex pheromone protein [Alteribacter populi]|uniref:CamS family sex pheromone protein n=1 Tax=Alteribacter populi TaxID=2011011 RepID=UPI000BBAAC18|nr:CamS family sex pheromone protein [Alteribacter populi]
MTKRLGVLSIVGLLVLSGCLPALEREEEVIVVEDENEEDEYEYVITPTLETPENYYRNVLRDGAYQRSPARGNVAHSMNNRIDIDQFEVGLMEIASANFSQDDYYFQEGEFLNGNTINSWLRRYDPSEERYEHGLNPSLGDGDDLEEQMRKNPAYLSHIMEHNYMYEEGEDGVQLGGVVIGLGLRSIYYFRTEDDEGRYLFHEEALDDEEVEAAGKEMAQEVLERLRSLEELQDVPIVIALYQEEKQNSLVPGSFIAMAESNSGTELGGWEQINEEFYFFPSNAATENRRDQAEAFNQFKNDVDDFFDHSIGVVGRARYKNNDIQEMKIDVNLQSHGKAEIIALTQFISGRLSSTFTFDASIHVYLESVSGTEALIVQYPGEEPFVHVYQ